MVSKIPIAVHIADKKTVHQRHSFTFYAQLMSSSIRLGFCAKLHSKFVSFALVVLKKKKKLTEKKKNMSRQ